jgi:CDP-glucose 4,6-dehydratase
VDQLVQRGAEVTILARDDVPRGEVARRWTGQVNEVHGEVEDQSCIERLLGEYDIQTVFHLAAQTQVEVANRNPVSTFTSNIAGTWSLLEACRRSPLVGQVVLASSDKAYGSQEVLPYTEESPLNAVHPYDVSKACAEMVARSYAETFAVPVCVTRCGNFFGGGDTNWRRLVPGTIRSLLDGERPIIRSDGSLTRDYLYVVDGALAYLRLAEGMAAEPDLAGEAFNFSLERPVSVLELVDLIQAQMGTDLPLEVLGTASDEIDHQALSANKAQKVLAWKPAYTLEDALVETIDWYRRELKAT